MNPQTNIIYTISRKFKYIRKTLYKKCDEINMFDHSCRDVEERLSFLINAVLSACILSYTNGDGCARQSFVGLNRDFVMEMTLLFVVDVVCDGGDDEQ